jgi:hypothetical protein
MDQSPDAPPQPAEYHRRKAAQARQQMKELTTPVMKARLLDLALHFDRLADRRIRVNAISRRPRSSSGRTGGAAKIASKEGTPASFRLLQRLIDYGIFLRPHLDGGVEGPSHPGQCDQPPASVFIRSHWWCPTSHRWYPDVFACAVPWSR